MKKYGLIGKTLKHSFSPQIHRMFGNYQYDLCETDEENLLNLINNPDYCGFNVTIPYKKTVMKYLDKISDNALAIGSVNTILKKNGIIYGDNTDYYGFKYMLLRKNINPEGLKVLILGSGGSCATAEAALRDLKVGEIVVISRMGENNYDNLHLHRDAGIIVNTTPVGMYPNVGLSPIDLDMFPQCRYAVDLIYNPLKTRFIIEAEKRNITAVGGIFMLVAQAKKSAELFTDKTINPNAEKNAVKKIIRKKQNIILIGMPSGGKTTLGKMLSEKTGYDFFDTDKIFEKRYSVKIENFIREKGINKFRELETEIIKECGMMNHCIIATGGGCVTVPENYYHLKQNGIIIWVKRDLSKLSSRGRPLSQSIGVENLYNQRKDLYEAWSDFAVENTTLKETLTAIMEGLENENFCD